ncbi:MAG: RNA-binding domain-containing protein [bacterium]
MKFAELLTHIEKGEDLHTEFKEQSIRSDELAASIVAFANTDGGKIIFGVDDSGKTVGIEDADQLMQFVDNVAFNNCEPPISVVQETVQDDSGQLVVVVHVLKGSQRPYRTNRGVHYVRTTSGRRQTSREELLRLFQSTASLFYDETPILHSSQADLDDGAMETLFEDVKAYGIDVAVIGKERILVNWRLIRDIDGEKHPTLAGILFLAQYPQKILPHAYISALRIPGSDISVEPRDQKHIEGSLVGMLQDAMKFLEAHLNRPHRIKGLEPEARFELPAEVLREALVNAMAHRDYTVSAPVRLMVFDDHVEIRTPGQLPNTVTLESLKIGVHVLRNPTIYNIFLKIGLVTDAGSGIPRMIRVLRDTINQEPDFRVEGNEFVVVLPRSSPAS